MRRRFYVCRHCGRGGRPTSRAARELALRMQAKERADRIEWVKERAYADSADKWLGVSAARTLLYDMGVADAGDGRIYFNA